jgi:pleiotropic regulator 1
MGTLAPAACTGCDAFTPRPSPFPTCWPYFESFYRMCKPCIFCLALHPNLDLLVTGGRDAVARVWDMRTKKQVHCLTGHDHTVAAIQTQSTHPAVITGSHDSTIKMWDLVAGKCMTTLTHHQKSIRAIAKPSFERTFVSGAADCLKKWQSKNGRFLKSISSLFCVVLAKYKLLHTVSSQVI